jgi:methylmalonyl-CoA/ethylmalonyl-CoA epimerase
MTAAVSSPFGLSQIAQIAITVKDLPRAIAFYRDTLGMRLMFEAPPAMAFFDCGSVRLMLATPEKPEFDHPASIIYFNVADIQQAARTLAQRGVAFEGEPHIVARLPHADIWMAFFRDMDRNLHALTSEVKRA